MKKNLYILFLFFFLCFAKVEKTKVTISEKSEIVIKGKSNVNKFECHYNKELIHSELLVTHIEKQNKIILTNAKIEVKSEGFDCAHKMITKDFKSVLKSHDYPHITIYINEIFTKENQLMANITVNIAGVQNKYNLPVAFDTYKNNVKGSLNINIKDYNLKSPKKLLGLIQLDEEVVIDFNLFIKY